MSQEEKLQAAIEYLGENWVLHPNYKVKKHHSVVHKVSHVLETFVAQRHRSRKSK